MVKGDADVARRAVPRLLLPGREQRIGKWNFYALNAPALKAFLEALEQRYLAPGENTKRNGEKGERA